VYTYRYLYGGGDGAADAAVRKTTAAIIRQNNSETVVDETVAGVGTDCVVGRGGSFSDKMV